MSDDKGSKGTGSLLRNPLPLRPQIDRANREIAVLVSRLNQAESRVKSRDQEMFRKVVLSVQKGDRERAAIYATELIQVRRLGTTVSVALLALEQVSLRLATVTELGEVAATLAPTVAVVKSIGTGLGSLMPDAKGQIDQISSLLSTTLVEAGSVGCTSLNFQAANTEAEKVLEEAAGVAYERVSSEFPEVPTLATLPTRDDEEEGLAI